MLYWKKGIPQVDGWYWVQWNLKDYPDAIPAVVFVHEFAGDRAIAKCKLTGWERAEKANWAGPIPLPHSEVALQGDV